MVADVVAEVTERHLVAAPLVGIATPRAGRRRAARDLRGGHAAAAGRGADRRPGGGAAL